MIERTLILAKPDAVQRGLVGEILKRFEQRGFRIVALKLINPTEQHLGMHYADDPVWKRSVGTKTRASMLAKGIVMKETDEEIGARVRRWNMECLRAPIAAMVFEGESAIEGGRKLVGSTEPKSAAPGTIRGDYSNDSYGLADKQQRVLRNLVHASGSVEEANKEITVWFTDKELYNYEKHDTKVLYG
jgi:nucleoside-diphosphate kinase